jgi:hypothetical protein
MEMQLLGMPVMDANDELIGTVEHIYIDVHTLEISSILAGQYLILKKAIRSITYKITLNIALDQPREFHSEPKVMHAHN